MDKLDRLIEKAKRRSSSLFSKNIYKGIDNNDLLDMLGQSQEDWREIVQAIVLNGGGFYKKDKA